MRHSLRGLVVAVLALGASALLAKSGSVAIPTFTPNVVDSEQVLRAEEVVEINAALEDIRGRADIWGAVWILDSLRDDSIEEAAERAFNQWKLGDKAKNNGLLLVLAMKERKSRFEVGYGLEGDLPDVVTRRALDQVLRAHMKLGETKLAILNSFAYLAGIKTKDPAFASESVAASNDDDLDLPFGDLRTERGLIALYFYVFLLWLVMPITRWRAFRGARRLSKELPDYRIQDDPAMNGGRQTGAFLFFGKSFVASVFIRLFLSVNPGIFIFFGASLHPLVLPGVALFCLFGSWLFYRAGTKRYVSKENYLAFIESARRQNQRMVAKGYMRETSPGHFDYTRAYYSSAEYRASRSSSSSGSSSSSSSSSSGGGSSGGGGSSSSW